jgi:glycosyltransferase involved in cell wall biosynthesis
MSSGRLPLSAFIICKDEASCIENCIRTLAECTEIVVVDSGSTDDTLKILTRLQSEGWPIRILQAEWPGFARQKQFALEQCRQEWVINIDADERLDPELRKSLPALLSETSVTGWRLARRPYLLGLGYASSLAHEGRMLRLVRRVDARYNTDLLVHEAILIKGKVATAPRGALLHFRLLPVDEQLIKEARYAVLKVRQLRCEGKRTRPFRLVFNPIVYFLRYYIVRRMFLCGFPGFIQSATGAVYTFLTEARMYQVEVGGRDAVEDDRRACGL